MGSIFPISECNYPLQAEHFKLKRKESHKTQQELCHIIKRDLKTYRKWENGTERPDCDVLIRLSALYGVSCDYLLGLIDEKNHDIKLIHEETGLSASALLLSIPGRWLRICIPILPPALSGNTPPGRML